HTDNDSAFAQCGKSLLKQATVSQRAGYAVAGACVVDDELGTAVNRHGLQPTLYGSEGFATDLHELTNARRCLSGEQDRPVVVRYLQPSSPIPPDEIHNPLRTAHRVFREIRRRSALSFNNVQAIDEGLRDLRRDVLHVT